MKRLLLTSVLLTCTVMMLLPAVASAEDKFFGLRAQRLAVGRALLEVQSTNWPEVIPYYTDDIEYHDPIVDIYGIEQMTGFLAQLLGSSPDLVTTIEDESLIGNTYCAI